ncbi:MAG TPA: amidase [Acidobacteriaceae bacterium]|jgi:aspartyl-tRNA(Asn)/glutamyl-tRNA(Gln) amidotransferase subunit A|nr:amidase [Acidobacteriaceae bacterium]
MILAPSPVAALTADCRAGTADPVAEAGAALVRANGSASRNTYIALDAAWTLEEARRQAERAPADAATTPLFGVPVSLKDCFDLAGFPTSSGSRFYAQQPAATADSWVAARLRAVGAVITGKTHLHQLAYGITGQNPDYGDCLQPANAALLTGGSSSGAAASIQEGSALAAIGTDTGGSVRAPAALCGLAGYRSSLGVGHWNGGWHLAPSFDTIGWLFRDLRDAPLLAHALFDLPPERPSPERLTVGVLTGPLVDDCDAVVRDSLALWEERLLQASARLDRTNPSFWLEAWDIYAPIQAVEAAKLHAGHFQEFDPGIAARLAWGASLTEETTGEFHRRLAAFRAELQQIFLRFDFLLAPVTPVSRLLAGEDQTDARARILRHTTPASLGGLPTVVLPSAECGVQLMAAQNDDQRLLRFAALLGEQLDRGTDR